MQVSNNRGESQVNPWHKINPSSGQAYSGEGLGTYGKKIFFKSPGTLVIVRYISIYLSEGKLSLLLCQKHNLYYSY